MEEVQCQFLKFQTTFEMLGKTYIRGFGLETRTSADVLDGHWSSLIQNLEGNSQGKDKVPT